MNTRQTILVSIAILLVAVLALWWYFGFSLEFMKFFAADSATTNTATTSASPTVSPLGDNSTASVVVACSPRLQSVKTGVAAQFTASGGSGSYEWFAPSGTPDTGTAKDFSVVYTVAGTKKVTVQAARGDDSGKVDSVECTVQVAP